MELIQRFYFCSFAVQLVRHRTCSRYMPICTQIGIPHRPIPTSGGPSRAQSNSIFFVESSHRHISMQFVAVNIIDERQMDGFRGEKESFWKNRSILDRFSEISVSIARYLSHERDAKHAPFVENIHLDALHCISDGDGWWWLPKRFDWTRHPMQQCIHFLFFL